MPVLSAAQSASLGGVVFGTMRLVRGCGTAP